MKTHPWHIIEDSFDLEQIEFAESIFSLGNGRMGTRGNFEEDFSGDSLQGSYMGGIYYPDKTRVGWWKVGYPAYYAKVPNMVNWLGIRVNIEGENLDLAKAEVEDYRRVLDMQAGNLVRSFTATLENGCKIRVESTRLISIVDDQAAVIRYKIVPLNFSGKMSVTPYLDFQVQNRDANYEEDFWEGIFTQVGNGNGYVCAELKKTNFQVCSGMQTFLTQNHALVKGLPVILSRERYVENEYILDVQEKDEIILYKYVANISSFYHPKESLLDVCKWILGEVTAKMFDRMLAEQAEAWTKKWAEMDVQIEGDEAAQQGIRFNLFQLHQTFTGIDARLNIGPKGFTGEKYGGSTYWDTEAYCLPFYLATAPQHVARNLLLYRYNQLPQAIENAQKLGFNKGAALFPMVTMNGEECHNEWEITFEEIHRNGAIVYAIYDYVRYTGDVAYLAEFGLEICTAVARFWAQRVNWSEAKQQYVLLGVTGPNEYENNVNNNWYTNYIAAWCLRYARKSWQEIRLSHPLQAEKLVQKCALEDDELENWQEIAEQIFLPEEENLGIFLQQEGYLDKELKAVSELSAEDLPLHKKWSWDRILRSCFVKQADVLQGLYFFEEDFSEEEIRQNYAFYEPKTVHESSLSPCVHAIVAARLGEVEQAYKLYLRTARLDLDNYNHDTADGCHITSMAGTWLAIVKGFAGMRVLNDTLFFQPQLPAHWRSLQFKIRFRGEVKTVKVEGDSVVF